MQPPIITSVVKYMFEIFHWVLFLDDVTNKVDNKLDNTTDEGKPALPDIFITATENQEETVPFKHLLSEEFISRRGDGKRDLGKYFLYRSSYVST